MRLVLRGKYQAMKMIRSTLLGFSVVVLTACSTTSSKAPVADRSPAAKNGNVERIAPDKPGYHTVRKGETLNRIARKFRHSPDNIAMWNNLANKNDIKVGQVLRVQPPSNQGAGVQTASVASSSGVEVKPLTAPARPASADKQPIVTQNQPVSPVVASTSSAANEAEGLSWMWPADGKILATFHEGKSKGIDIAGTPGQKVLAAADGRVIFASAIRGYGNLVILKHSDNLVSAYAHNKTILVKEGAVVSKGQQIAEMGNSDSDSVKLHLEIRRQGKPVDPTRYLPAR